MKAGMNTKELYGNPSRVGQNARQVRKFNAAMSRAFRHPQGSRRFKRHYNDAMRIKAKWKGRIFIFYPSEVVSAEVIDSVEPNY